MKIKIINTTNYMYLEGGIGIKISKVSFHFLKFNDLKFATTQYLEM